MPFEKPANQPLSPEEQKVLKEQAAQEIKNVFGHSPENIPDIPFSAQELKRAEEISQEFRGNSLKPE